MSQQRLYISYLGGAVFSGDTGVAPWLQQEADGGNPEAQYQLAARYLSGSGVPADRQKAAAWLKKAAAQGRPAANMLAGRLALRAGRFGDAANSLSQAASQFPDDQRAPLYLYLARLQGGDGATGARTRAAPGRRQGACLAGAAGRLLPRPHRRRSAVRARRKASAANTIRLRSRLFRGRAVRRAGRPGQGRGAARIETRRLRQAGAQPGGVARPPLMLDYSTIQRQTMSIESLRAVPFLMLALAPLAAQAAGADACRYVPVATLALRGTGTVWQPTVDGTINGKPAVMLFDTGGSATRLVKDAAEKFHIALQQTGGYSYGIGGASVSYLAKVDDFAVGAAHSGRIQMNVLGNMGRQPQFDAIIGADIALQMDLEISLAEHQVKFYRASGCDDTYLAYWSQEAMEIPFGGTETGHKNPRMIVDVNGTKMEAMIDTGASGTTMSRAAAERAGIRVGAPEVVKVGTSTGIGDARIDVWQTTVDNFTIGSETIKNAHLGIRDNAPQGTMIGFPDILLGADFLRAHRVLIAMSQRRFYITYNGGEVFPLRRLRAN
jgi:predicted aspartyl protease